MRPFQIWISLNLWILNSMFIIIDFVFIFAIISFPYTNLFTNKFLYSIVFLFLPSLAFTRPFWLWWCRKIQILLPTHKCRFAEYALNIVRKLGWRSRCYLDVHSKQIAHESLLIYGELFEVLLEIFFVSSQTTLL